MTLLVALVPLFLLIGSLLAGRYVGVERIASLAARRSRPARRPRARALVAVPAAARILPRGGRLVAASLAQRGPPAVLAAT
jgi:hypothetical protein